MLRVLFLLCDCVACVYILLISSGNNTMKTLSIYCRHDVETYLIGKCKYVVYKEKIKIL